MKGILLSIACKYRAHDLYSNRNIKLTNIDDCKFII